MENQEIKEREKYTIWRRRNRVRIVDIAQYCDVSSSYISMWENGKRPITPETLAKYDEYISNFEKGKLYATNE